MTTASDAVLRKPGEHREGVALDKRPALRGVLVERGLGGAHERASRAEEVGGLIEAADREQRLELGRLALECLPKLTGA